MRTAIDGLIPRLVAVPLAGVLVTVGAACSAGPSAPASEVGGAPTHNHSGHDHSGHDQGAGAAPARLDALLLRVEDLPGYAEGPGHAHHGAPDGPAPRVSAGCLPLAEVLGEHARAPRGERPQARRAFTKSHFGPTVTETVVDHGDPVAARAALAALAGTPGTCPTYEQGRGRIGAQRYDVRPGTVPSAAPDGDAVRLVALGRDFQGITWDLWATTRGPLLVVVAQRSAPGGRNADLPAAARAAVHRLG